MMIMLKFNSCKHTCFSTFWYCRFSCNNAFRYFLFLSRLFRFTLMCMCDGMTVDKGFSPCVCVTNSSCMSVFLTVYTFYWCVLVGGVKLKSWGWDWTTGFHAGFPCSNINLEDVWPMEMLKVYSCSNSNDHVSDTVDVNVKPFIVVSSWVFCYFTDELYVFFAVL